MRFINPTLTRAKLRWNELRISVGAEAVDKISNLGDEFSSRFGLGDIQRACPVLVHAQTSGEVGEETICTQLRPVIVLLIWIHVIVIPQVRVFVAECIGMYLHSTIDVQALPSKYKILQ